MTLRNYSNTAPPVSLTVAVAPADLTLTVASTTGYPAAPFLLGLERGTANEEVCLCTATTATTFTVTRGYDGTSAKSHAIGTSIEHTVAALDYDEPNDHINDTNRDDHTQYLDTTRHDSTDRHTAGTVVPTGVPLAITPQIATAAEGAATTLARSNHVHGNAAPPTPTTITAGATTAAVGTSTAFATGNHVHGNAAPPTPTTITAGATTAAVGTSTAFATGNHVHGSADFAPASHGTHGVSSVNGRSGAVTGLSESHSHPYADTSHTHVMADLPQMKFGREYFEGTGGTLTGSFALGLSTTPSAVILTLEGANDASVHITSRTSSTCYYRIYTATGSSVGSGYINWIGID